MKKLFFYLLGGAMMLNSCTDDSGIFVPDGIKEPTLPTESKPNEAVKGDVFSKLNLDYPGLEKVKQHYEAGEHYLAAKELLEYYRWRSSVINPFVPTVVKATADDINKADQALNYQFYVRGFYEKKENDVEIYYCFLKDGKIDWDLSVPNVTDQEFRYQRHRHQWMEPQAKAYATTKNENYIKNWIEVYTDWMNTYPCPVGLTFPEGESNDVNYQWKGLQPAERVLSQINIIQYYLSSPNFTPEWLCTVLNAFAESVECIRLNYYADSNILITQSQAVAFAGVLMPEFTKSEEWANEGARKLNEELDKQFLSDGTHYELDPSYHIAAIEDFRSTYEVFKVNNSNVLPADFISRLEKASEFVADLIYPNYTIDNFNDTRNSSYSKSVLIKNLNNYKSMFPENNLIKWMASEGKEGTTPDYTTKAYPESGYYMLRDGWKPDGMMMVLKNNDNKDNKWHCQPDNGTFGIVYKGRNFFPDAGVYAYSGGDRTIYRASKNHNTLTALSKDYESAFQKGKFVKMESTGNTDVLITEHEIKAGLTHRRTVFFVEKKFFVILDETYGNTNGDKINYNLHMLSDENQELGNKATEVIDESVSSQTVTIYTNFADRNNMIAKVYSQSNTDIQVVSSETNYSNAIGVSSGKRKSVQFNARKAKEDVGRFITVICPFTEDGASFNNNIGINFLNSQLDNNKVPLSTEIKVTMSGKDYNLNYTL